jgi:putative hemolysin
VGVLWPVRRFRPIPAELIVILALILINGFFSGAEIAIVSLRRTRLAQLVEEKRAGADAVAALRAEPERFLATVQIGITVVGTAAAAFGGARLARHMEPLLQPLPVVGGDDAGQVALGIVVVVIAFLSLVLGELVPKSLALRVGETYALLVAKPLLALSWLARPFVWLLTASSNVVLRPFSDRTTFMESRVSMEELQVMVGEAAASGAVDEHASEIASRALEFDKLSFADVMTPRSRIDALPLNASHAQVQRFLLEEQRSRIPVYDGTLDNIVGYVSAKDIVALAWEGQLVVLHDLLRPVKLFPQTVPAIEVLRFMRREHQRLAIGIDQHGVVSGLVTFEDLVEELVGEVFSEDEERTATIAKGPDGSAVVTGEVNLRDLNRELGLELEVSEGVTTVAGLAIQLAGGIPNRNARLAASDGAVLVVLDASPRGVRRVRVIPPPALPTVASSDRDLTG